MHATRPGLGAEGPSPPCPSAAAAPGRRAPGPTWPPRPPASRSPRPPRPGGRELASARFVLGKGTGGNFAGAVLGGRGVRVQSSLDPLRKLKGGKTQWKQGAPTSLDMLERHPEFRLGNGKVEESNYTGLDITL